MGAEIETGPGEDHIALRRAVRHRQIGGCGGLQRSGERDHADAGENVFFHRTPRTYDATVERQRQS